MPKVLTDEEKRAAFKARDEADRLDRARLDAETLDALIALAEAAQLAAADVETRCGELVSDLSHHALKAQANRGPSVQLSHIVTLAKQSRAAIALAIAPAPDQGAA